ncbi:MAG: rRNA maturation RNase YbeY [Bacilli bacterium]
MNKISVFNSTEEDVNSYMKTVKKLLRYTLRKEKVKKALCNVIFVDNERIMEINRDYRNVDAVTDVISFALEDDASIVLPVRVLGDIYIAIPRAREQALSYGHSLEREIAFLSVHGLLHLLGYDHMNKKDEEIMFQRQEEVLNSYGIVR